MKHYYELVKDDLISVSRFDGILKDPDTDALFFTNSRDGNVLELFENPP